VFYYLLYGSLLDITVLLNLSPIIVALLERIIFKHPIHKSVAISLLVSFVGALCVLQPDKGIFSLLSFVGLIAALASGTSQVVYGHNARKEPTSVSLFYLFFIGSIVSFLVLLIYQAFANESVVKATSSFLFGDWAPLLFLLALSLCTITNQSFRGLAYQHGRPAVLAPFLYFSVFFSALFDWLIFHNTLNTLEIVGILLILLGGFLQIFLRKVAHFK
jgi:S-adenosylmethionine uptake transporter